MQRTRRRAVDWPPAKVVAPDISNVLQIHYANKVEKWQSFLRDGGKDEGGALEGIEHSFTTIKLIRKLPNTG